MIHVLTFVILIILRPSSAGIAIWTKTIKISVFGTGTLIFIVFTQCFIALVQLGLVKLLPQSMCNCLAVFGSTSSFKN